MIDPSVSVLICTHNPQSSYIEKVLYSLQTQTLSIDAWELLFIDNASDECLRDNIDLTWHPNSKHLHEDKIGLTQARLCGIHAARGNLIVFVDDDNVLEPNYLQTTYQIAQAHPDLGAWGGQTLPWFEQQPPAWTRHYWPHLGIRSFDNDRITDTPDMSATPIGAGICVRRAVAQKYVDSIANSQSRLSLGRSGSKLLGHEDIDLAYTSFDLGLKVGVFKDLKLTHLIPSNRLQPEYLFSLAEGTGYSETWIAFHRGFLPSLHTWKKQLRLSLPWLINPKAYFLHPKARKFAQFSTKGRIAAMREILALERTRNSEATR